MNSEIANFVKRCKLCALSKPARNSQISQLISEIPATPFSKIYLDFSGPYPCLLYTSLLFIYLFTIFEEMVNGYMTCQECFLKKTEKSTQLQSLWWSKSAPLPNKLFVFQYLSNHLCQFSTTELIHLLSHVTLQLCAYINTYFNVVIQSFRYRFWRGLIVNVYICFFTHSNKIITKTCLLALPDKHRFFR